MRHPALNILLQTRNSGGDGYTGTSAGDVFQLALKRFDFTVQRSQLLTMNFESEHRALFDGLHIALGWADENQFRVHQIVDPIFVPNYWYSKRQFFFSLEPIVRGVFWSIQAPS